MHTKSHPLSKAIAASFAPAIGLTLALFALPTLAEDATTDSMDTITVSASALKVETPLAETPRSVSVINEEQLSIQKPTKLDEALRYQPGVVTQPYGSDTDTDWIKVRGFDAATYLDGNRLYTTGYYVWTLEPFGLEQIEVLKGPSAILYGEAPPGGVVNAVTKKPGYTEGGEIEMQVGTRSQRQLGVDVTSFVDDDGDVRFRLVGMMNERDGVLDGTNNNRLYLAPSLAWDISPDTTLTLLASYKKDDGVPTNGFFPAYGTLIDTPQGKIDPSTNLGEPDYDTNENSQFSVGYELEHHFDDTWSIKQNTRYAHTELFLRSTYAFPNSTSSDLSRGLVYRDGTTDSITMDNQVTAEWDTTSTENTTLFGAELQHFNNKSKELDDYGVLTGNIDAFNPVYGNYTPTDSTTDFNHIDTDKNSMGLYAQQITKLNEQWVFRLGGRYDVIRVEDSTRNFSSDSSNDNHYDNFSTSAGLMYISDIGLSPYASYSESFEVITGIDPATNEPYKPLDGKQTEIGIKYEPSFINGYINVAWFNIEQKNALVTNPATFVQTQTGKLTSQGVEVDLVANVTKAMLVRANYTYTDARTDETYGNGTDQQAGIIPRHMASTWVEYDFSHLGMNGFMLGAGVRYNGESVDNPASSDLTVPSYTVFDAMARYDITKKWRAQVNVNNLTNKEYVASCDYYCYYGEEMSATATLNYRW